MVCFIIKHRIKERVPWIVSINISSRTSNENEPWELWISSIPLASANSTSSYKKGGSNIAIISNPENHVRTIDNNQLTITLRISSTKSSASCCTIVLSIWNNQLSERETRNLIQHLSTTAKLNISTFRTEGQSIKNHCQRNKQLNHSKLNDLTHSLPNDKGLCNAVNMELNHVL